ncbi:MAG: MmcQ/YjbR family DNA-binding protein [Clostridia bacterium]|nr:MmcQ/YjbR family DNA-binding protein [Clostridia bacterium]
MTLEEEVFRRRRFLPETLEQNGFHRKKEGFEIFAPLMGGDFEAVLTLSDKGEIAGDVIDAGTGESYIPLRAEIFDNAYVNKVRDAYKTWLLGIAERCCGGLSFPSEQANRIAAAIRDRFGVKPDFPWKDNARISTAGVFRHGENNKWFALVMDIRRGALLKNEVRDRVDVMNLKMHPDEIPALCQRAGIYPAYHMNRKFWISVTLDGVLADEDVMELVQISFDLTK